jgi:hypothetical protein
MFNIGSQNAGNNIVNVARDQINISSPGSSITIQQARNEYDRLRGTISASSVPRPTVNTLERELKIVEEELHASQPNNRRMGAALHKLTEILQNTGTLAKAGESLAQPIAHLARWLGATGVPILGLLGIN